MLRLGLIIAVCMLAFVPAPAAGQAVGGSVQGFGANDWSEEPNVLVGGTVPSNPYNDASATYPADDNGLPAAFEGLAPVRVLSAKWMPYVWPGTVVGGTWSGTGTSGVFNPDINNILRPFVGSDFIYPTTRSTFIAFYGDWTDLNKDKIRDDEGHWRNSIDGHDRPIYVRANPRDNCQEQPMNVAPGGSTTFAGGKPGNLVPVGVTVPVTIEKRCLTPDEWSPPPGWFTTTRPQVVSYVSPGNWFGFSGPGIATPCPIPVFHARPGDCDPRPSQQGPDISYTAGDFYGEGTYSWTAVYTDTEDGSLLETKVVETISEPVRTVAPAPRTHERGPGSLVDTDVYSSVDPAIEALFQTTLHGVENDINAVTGGQNDKARVVFSEYSAVVNTTSALLAGAACDPSPAMAAKCLYQPTVGPKLAPMSAPRVPENTGYDHKADFHVYLDLRMRESAHAGLLASATTGSVTNSGENLVLVGDNLNPFGFDQLCVNGGCGAVARMAVDGNFGRWKDTNGDGFIGDVSKNNRATPTCPDAYDCGLNNSPHAYSTPGSEGEFLPACLPGKSGAFQLTLTPDGNSWGKGAYLMYDKDSDVDSTQGGRASFNPYDDIVTDAADGKIDRLYTTGNIRMWVVCTGNNGVYNAFEDVVLLDGRNEYGITMTTDVISMTFDVAGTPVTETVSDTDYSAPWNL